MATLFTRNFDPIDATAYATHRLPASDDSRETDLRIDLSRYEVCQDGRRLDLQPLPFDLLTHLARNRHRVVTREELLDVVWRGAAVCEGAITQAVWTVRRALRDKAGAQRLIRTVHRRGYQFVGTCSIVGVETHSNLDAVVARGTGP